jgi:hypothetical protein
MGLTRRRQRQSSEITQLGNGHIVNNRVNIRNITMQDQMEVVEMNLDENYGIQEHEVKKWKFTYEGDYFDDFFDIVTEHWFLGYCKIYQSIDGVNTGTFSILTSNDANGGVF